MTNTRRIQLFHGQISAQTANVYARVADLPGGGEWTLTGQLRGPHCQLAQTLPAVTRFIDGGPGPSLLARATLTDPCTWSGQLPAFYRVNLELRCRDQLVEFWHGMLGLRALGARGRNLYWVGKRWVLRGVQLPPSAEAAWSLWRDLCAVQVLDQPDDEVCEAASREGVAILARCDAARVEVESELQRLAQWPAVAVAWIDGHLPRHDLVMQAPQASSGWRQAGPNLLLASSLADPHHVVPEWAHLAIVDAALLPRVLSEWKEISLPLIAWRPGSGAATLAEARHGCDRLQRELAPVGDFAGYIA